MSEYLNVSNVTRRFGGFTAVDNISFRLSKGQVLGFLGPNGAGKTTTMRMITGYMRPTSGEISVCGLDIAKNPIETKQNTGYLPEGVPLYSEMTPRLFLKFIAGARGLRGREIEERLSFVTDKLMLDGVMDQSIETLSKGFKRRVAFAQSIIHDPKLLILDEPTDGLDPVQKQEVRRLIREMASEKSIIISTHILEEVSAVCDRIIIISNGQIITDETPSSLVKKHKYHNAISFELANSDREEAVKEFSNLPEVKEVEVKNIGQTNRFYIIPEDSRDISKELFNVLVNKKWDFSSFSAHQGNLEEVFREMVTGNN